MISEEGEKGINFGEESDEVARNGHVDKSYIPKILDLSIFLMT